MIEQSLYDALRLNAPVAALVGTRIRAMRLKQGDTFPALVYSRISTAAENDLDGHAGLDNCRFQVDCYSEGFTEARTLAAAVKTAMNAAGHLQAGDRDIYDDDLSLHRVTLDFSIWTQGD